MGPGTVSDQRESPVISLLGVPTALEAMQPGRSCAQQILVLLAACYLVSVFKKKMLTATTAATAWFLACGWLEPKLAVKASKDKSPEKCQPVPVLSSSIQAFSCLY